MAGNREAYEQFMQAGLSAAWDHNWDTAIESYGKALQEFPEDPEVHIQLGMALLEQEHLDQALKIFTRGHQLSPDDATPLEMVATVLERQGRKKEASEQYVNVAEVHLGNRDLDKAISSWAQAAKLMPGLVPVHAKLARAYERTGDKRRAIYEYLMLGYAFQKRDRKKAIGLVNRALQINRRNSEALNARRALETGQDMSPPAPVDEDLFDLQDEEVNLFSLDDDDVEAEPDSDIMGPMGEAMNEALTLLANHVMESGALDASSGAALQAMEHQRQGAYDQAVDAYLQATSSLKHPALHMNLGALMVLAGRFKEATKHLDEAARDPDMAAGALHGLGQAYLNMEKAKQGSEYLIKSLLAVDTSMAVDENEIAEHRNVYETLLGIISGSSEEFLAESNKRFVELLQGSDWRHRIPEMRRFWKDKLDAEGAEGIKDSITEKNARKLAETVSTIDRYLRQGMLTLAMDEAHWAMEFAAFYLPLHSRMAEVMRGEGRVRQAMEKYNMIARTYLVRGETDRAASILGEALEMSPLDIALRKSLIDLLESEGQQQAVFDEYVNLADAYHQLGDQDSARDIYDKAHEMAEEQNAPLDRLVHIKHRLADLDQFKLDFRSAQRAYEKIVELAPEDERARRMLVEMNFRQGNQIEAISQLDKLLSLYVKKKQTGRVIKFLEELVRSHPDDMGVRSRLALIYRQMGRTEDAINALDALAEQQLEAGLHDEACKALKQIVALKPANVQEYEALISQLGC